MCVDHVGLDNLVLLLSSIPLALVLSLPPILQGSLTPARRELMDPSHIELSVPRSLILCVVSGCGSLYLLHLLQEEASMMLAATYEDHWESFVVLLLCVSFPFLPPSLPPSLFPFLPSSLLPSFLSISSIWFYSRSLGHLLSDSWSAKQYHV